MLYFHESIGFLPGKIVFFLRHFSLILLSMALLLTTGCAKRPPNGDLQAIEQYENDNDPLEPMNRAIFSFNEGFDRTILEPAARFYRQFGPPDIRKGVSNFVNNWREPLTFVNDILQAKPGRAFSSMSRFVINSTFGLLGILDTATYWGIEHHSEDFGETFAVWGIGEGPYLMLPILGPSNVRDFTGFMTEFFYDPVSLWLDHKGWTYVRYGRLALRGLIYREENLETLDDLGKSSTDFYATIRSAYRQNRNYDINNGVLDTTADDDLFDEADQE
ncbi:MAG: VacJ family lipoprotein [Emcibacter sp.]|nr:VacJ family lipoprotein [Emcibacter sp.]